MTHLLVTNDFPPKLGGIQSYLWDLWSRLDPSTFAVLTIDHDDAAAFDAAAPFRIERLRMPMLLPLPSVARAIDSLAREIGATLVVLDPALPLGTIGRSLSLPYAVVLHGAEITVPARLPGMAALLRRVLGGASLLVSGGGYALGEARRLLGERLPPAVVVPPGVDTRRFRPLAADERYAARLELGLPAEGRLVVSVSRLVPRKGMDVLIEAAGLLGDTRPDLTVAIGGTGRDLPRLTARARRSGAPVRFLGRVADDDLPRLIGAADVFAMLCRTRWLGLEQEGFGIVFLEAAAGGIPSLAGRSGGAGEAVLHGRTGLVVDRPGDVVVAAAALAELLDDEERRGRLGADARHRAASQFDQDLLAGDLAAALAGAGG